MNRKDTARLTELRNRIWAKVAQHLRHGFDPELDGDRNDPYVVTAREIEDHRGRLPKAIRLLQSESYVTPFGQMVDARHYSNDPVDAYRVLRFEESEAIGQKPMMKPHHGSLNNELEYATHSPEKIARVGYCSTFTDVEEIYIYWHQKEFVADPARPHYLFDKSLLDLLHKRIMFVLVERRMKEDFPGLVQLIAPEITAVSFQKTTLVLPNPITFQNFRPEELAKCHQQFEAELERMTRYKGDLGALLDWVEKHGGFAEAIKMIRQRIIFDFLNGFERFPQGFVKRNRDPLAPGQNDEGKPGRSKALFRFFDKFRGLIEPGGSYDSLYLDPEIGTEEVFDIKVGRNWYSDTEISSLPHDIDQKEFGYEKRDAGATGSSVSTRAA